MTQAPELSKYYVRYEKPTGFPFNSPGYDPFAANGLRCEDLVDSLVRFSDASTAKYFEVVNGEGSKLFKICLSESVLLMDFGNRAL